MDQVLVHEDAFKSNPSADGGKVVIISLKIVTDLTNGSVTVFEGSLPVRPQFMFQRSKYIKQVEDKLSKARSPVPSQTTKVLVLVAHLILGSSAHGCR